MKRLFLSFVLFVLVLSGGELFSQDTIRFSYDESGNRISRVITLNKSSRIRSQEPISENATKEIVDNALSERIVKIFPNPTEGLLGIEVIDNSLDNNVIHIIVLDINGKKIIEKRAEPLRSIIDLSGFPDGIYFLLLKEGTKVSKWKIIKQQ